MALIIRRSVDEEFRLSVESNVILVKVLRIRQSSVDILVKSEVESRLTLESGMVEEIRMTPEFTATLSVFRISGKQVSFRISAPPEVRVVRGELPTHNGVYRAG
jgi:sRNA-binding carbon storage regulator CsrA